jgi:hypothetical protein
MNIKDKKIDLIHDAIMNRELSKVKKIVNQGVDIHYANDYFLYLATFQKSIELQKYFINLGLVPEVTKGRLAVSDPEGLEYLRNLKREKEAMEFAESLNQALPNQNNNKKQIKL